MNIYWRQVERKVENLSMTAPKATYVLFALFLAACGSNTGSDLARKDEETARSTCDPGLVMERLETEMKTGLGGAGREKISRLYDVYFQIIRRCDKVQDMDFVVKQEWGDKGMAVFMAVFLDFPPLSPYLYAQKRTRSRGLCLSREGMESELLSAPKWYCEKGGWTNEI